MQRILSWFNRRLYRLPFLSFLQHTLDASYVVSVGSLGKNGGLDLGIAYLKEWFKRHEGTVVVLVPGVKRSMERAMILEPGTQAWSHRFGEAAVYYRTYFPEIWIGAGEHYGRTYAFLRKRLSQKPQLVLLHDAFRAFHVLSDCTLLYEDAPKFDFTKESQFANYSFKAEDHSKKECDILGKIEDSEHYYSFESAFLPFSSIQILPFKFPQHKKELPPIQQFLEEHKATLVLNLALASKLEALHVPKLFFYERTTFASLKKLEIF